MTPQPSATVAMVDSVENALQFAICPMCHKAASLTQSAVDAGGDWQCERCDQHWDAGRLAAVHAYAAWVVRHDALAAKPAVSGNAV